MPFDGREVTLLAGIRADGATFIAFPCACSGHSVAVMKADFRFYEQEVVRFTVAGAAQVKSMVMSDKLSPASR